MTTNQIKEFSSDQSLTSLNKETGITVLLTRSLREPGGPCTKSMEVSESCMERVKDT